MDRETMLAVRPTREPVDVPEWGGRVYVHQLDGAELVEWSEACDGLPKVEKSTALLVRCVRDEAGELIFKPTDAAELVKLPGGMVNRLCARANKVNKLTTDAAKDAEKK
jgi:hypothetical protein